MSVDCVQCCSLHTLFLCTPCRHGTLDLTYYHFAALTPHGPRAHGLSCTQMAQSPRDSTICTHRRLQFPPTSHAILVVPQCGRVCTLARFLHLDLLTTTGSCATSVTTPPRPSSSRLTASARYTPHSLWPLLASVPPSLHPPRRSSLHPPHIARVHSRVARLLLVPVSQNTLVTWQA